MTSIRRVAAACLTASLLWCLAEGAPPARAETTLKVVMHSDLKIVDPIWTTAYIVRNHGYMIYDTLFATDAKGVESALSKIPAEDAAFDKALAAYLATGSTGREAQVAKLRQGIADYRQVRETRLVPAGSPRIPVS